MVVFWGLRLKRWTETITFYVYFWLTVFIVLLVGLEVLGGLDVLKSFVPSFFNPRCFLPQRRGPIRLCWYRCGMAEKIDAIF